MFEPDDKSPYDRCSDCLVRQAGTLSPRDAEHTPLVQRGFLAVSPKVGPAAPRPPKVRGPSPNAILRVHRLDACTIRCGNVCVMDAHTLVIAVLAPCAAAVILGLFLQSRVRRRVSVRIARCDGGYAAIFAPPRRRSVQVLDHSMSYLSKTGSGGDGLFRSEDAAFTAPVTVRFVHHTPGQRMEFERGDDRVRPLLPGQGGAAWIQYRDSQRDVRAATVLVLWRASARLRGKKPEVVRGVHADQWIDHILTPKSPAPTSLPLRIRRAITPAWLADPENRQAVNVVGAVLGVVILLVLAVVALDLSSLRSAVPLTSEYDWLGFAGGLLGGVAGGVMTLAGVMLTLRNSTNSERQRQQDEGMRTRLSVMPLLDLKISDDSELFDNSRGQLAGLGWVVMPLGERGENLGDSVQHHLAVIAQNIGLGHARIRYMTVDRHREFGEMHRLGDIAEPNALLQIGQQQVIRMSLAQPPDAATGTETDAESVMLTLTIYYEDLLGNRYRQELDALLFMPLPKPESHEAPPPSSHLSLRAVKPPEFAGIPDGNAYWFH